MIQKYEANRTFTKPHTPSLLAVACFIVCGFFVFVFFLVVLVRIPAVEESIVCSWPSPACGLWCPQKRVRPPTTGGDSRLAETPLLQTGRDHSCGLLREGCWRRKLTNPKGELVQTGPPCYTKLLSCKEGKIRNKLALAWPEWPQPPRLTVCWCLESVAPN